MTDIQTIAKMLDLARRFNLEAEVVMTWGNERATGASVLAAAISALWEWDIDPQEIHK